jgi:hypothetical protein
MTETDILRNYYERIVRSDFPHAAGAAADGRKRFNAVNIRGCHGNSKNQLFFSLDIRDGRIRHITYECQYCDVTMYVTAEIICELSEGLFPEDIARIDDADVARALGGRVRKVERQARVSLGLLHEGLGGGP